MRARWSLIPAAGLAVALGVATVAAQDGDLSRYYFKKTDSKLEPYGFVSLKHVWKTRSVVACWENPTSATLHVRQIVEQTVADSWEKATKSNIRFVGWQSCESDQDGVHVVLVDDASGPGARYIGNRLDGINNGVRLNPTFANWEHEACGKRADECLRITSIHEFGHVLGLLHENKRQETPTACLASGPASHDDSIVPSDADDLQTPYDALSIMNYCNKIYAQKPALSEGDVKVASLMYPIPGN